ncbi:MAG TPA: protein kinase [Kofleriaceae bacterium]|nr:protein kinase [Kofleriaceae bacterium]
MARGVRIGDYQIEQELDGSLYRAVHLVLPRRALLKISRDTTESVAVLREACILAALPHPGIVRVYETGRLPDQRTWFAQEIVDGLTLSGTFALGAIEPAVAIGMIRDVAEILAFAHQRGVIHCGITADCLLVASRNRGFPMCVTDWSAARPHDAAPAPAAPGAWVAPELAAGDVIDDRADVYSLGLIAYRAISGVGPFDSSTTRVPLGVHCPEVPRELTNVVDSMLAPDRWDRPSAAEVRAELGFLAGTLATLRAPAPVRIRRPRWTPQVDLGTKLRADTEADPGILPGTRDDVE